MIGVVDVGGGLRGIYGAGVLDRCLDEKIYLDYGIGVSAGSANMASYFGRQKGRNYVYYIEYSFRKEYMSFHNFRTKKNYVDLDYVYGTLSNRGGEYPLDYGEMMKNGKGMKVVATDAETGKAVYFDRSDMSWDDYGAFKCSSCLPVVCEPYQWKGGKYFDGGLSDPVPVRKAMADGCDKVVVILTRPRDKMRSSSRDVHLAKLMRNSFPNIRKDLENRSETYNTQLKDCIELEKQGKVLIVAPDSIEGLKTLTKDKEKLQQLYDKGYADAEAIKAFIS